MSITYYLSIALATLVVNPICPLTSAQNHSKNCRDQCGDVMIKYPFGIGSGCSSDENFTIFCNESSPNPKPFISRLNVELLESSSWPDLNEVIVMMPAYNSCTAATDRTLKETVWSSLDLTGTAFTFSIFNTFSTIGCQGIATLHNVTGGMIAACSSNCDEVMVGCNGYLCCQSGIDSEYLGSDVVLYDSLSRLRNHRLKFDLLQIRHLTFKQALGRTISTNSLNLLIYKLSVLA